MTIGAEQSLTKVAAIAFIFVHWKLPTVLLKLRKCWWNSRPFKYTSFVQKAVSILMHPLSIIFIIHG